MSDSSPRMNLCSAYLLVLAASNRRASLTLVGILSTKRGITQNDAQNACNKIDSKKLRLSLILMYVAREGGMIKNEKW